MAIARADETDLLIPLHEGVHDGWRVFLARLQQRLRAGEAAIIVRSGDAVARFGVAGVVGEAGLDPWLAGLRRGRVYAASERGEKRPGRFVRADDVSGVSAWLAVARDGREFSAADGALLGALAPHLAVALRTFVVLERARLREAVSAVVLGRAGVGWIAFARDARVLAASDVVTRIGERLVGVRSEEGAVVAAFCLAPGMPVAVPLGEGALLLVPGVGEVSAIGLVTHPRNRDGATQAEVLASLYGLAPSEARLAAAVAGGLSLAEAAVALGLTIETARNYSKRVFAKMRVRGQVEMVRAVLGGVGGFA